MCRILFRGKNNNSSRLVSLLRFVLFHQLYKIHRWYYWDLGLRKGHFFKSSTDSMVGKFLISVADLAIFVTNMIYRMKNIVQQ